MAAVQGAVNGEKPEGQEADLESAETPEKNEPQQEGVTSKGRQSFAIVNADDISFEIESQSRPSGVS